MAVSIAAETVVEDVLEAVLVGELREQVVADERREIVGRLRQLVVLEDDPAVDRDVGLRRAQLGDVDGLALEGLGHRRVASGQLGRAGDVDSVGVLERLAADRVGRAVGRHAELELVGDRGEVAHLGQACTGRPSPGGRRTRSGRRPASSWRTVIPPPLPLSTAWSAARLTFRIAGLGARVVEGEAAADVFGLEVELAALERRQPTPCGRRSRSPCDRRCSRWLRAPGHRSRPSAWLRRSRRCRAGWSGSRVRRSGPRSVPCWQARWRVRLEPYSRRCSVMRCCPHPSNRR